LTGDFAALLRRPALDPGLDGQGLSLDDGWQRERLAVLIQDGEWIRSRHAVMVAFSRLQLETISRWVSTFAILNDDEQVARIERAMRLIEATRALDTKLLASGEDTTEKPVGAVLDDWPALLASFRREANYWYTRYQADAEIRDEGQRKAEAERDGVIEAEMKALSLRSPR
jgi:hypothetical protein